MNRKKTKLVVFDYDGVIIQTEALHSRLLAEDLRNMGIDFTREDISLLMGGSDRSRENLYDSLFADQPGYWKNKESLLHAHRVYPPEAGLLSEGMKDVLEQLKEKGVRCAAVTTSSTERLLAGLESAGILSYFGDVLSGEQTGHVKPDPYIYEETMRRAQVLPEETVIVEDSGNGIEAGKRAGAYVAALKDTEGYADQRQADIIINRMKEVLDLLVC